MVDKSKQGKKNRISGSTFELRVRKDLEDKGWVVDKWGNNVSDFPDSNINLPSEDREDRKLIQAKNKWAGPNRPMMMGAGFPDFVCFKNTHKFGEITYKEKLITRLYEVIGVESKTNGILDKEERDKCEWLLDNNKFSKILIAEKTKVKNRIVIVYHDFEEKYGKL